MKNAPRVSVLMSVYNGEKYLKQSIDSILSQTFADFEFIIVNDGSTDSTEGILQSYTDDRIALIDNGRNIGLIKSLNKGLETARGEYVARMDADDISMPERFEKQVAFLNKHHEVVLLGSAVRVINENGRIVRTIFTPTSHEEICARLLFGNCFGHSSIMFRTYIVRKLGGYDEDFVHAEDYELWWRLSQAGRVANLPEALNCWRKNLSHGVSFTKRREQQLCTERVALKAVRTFIGKESSREDAYNDLQKYLKYVAGEDTKQYIKKHLAELYFDRGYIKLNEGDNRLARTNLLRSLECGNLDLRIPFLVLLTLASPNATGKIRRMRGRLLRRRIG